MIAFLLKGDKNGCSTNGAIGTERYHDIFVGPLGVTISTGFAVHSGSTLTITVPERVQLYAVTNSGTHTLYVLQIGGR